jgi:Galactose oxidase, central domain
VTPLSASIYIGQSQAFTAIGNFSGVATPVDLTGAATWTSTPAATMSGGIADSVSVGTATITAALGTAFGTASLTVQPVLTSITLTPSGSVAVGGPSLPLTVTGYYSDTTAQNLTSSATWNISPSGSATVVGGSATGVVGGVTTITATVYIPAVGTFTSNAVILTVYGPRQFMPNGNMTSPRFGQTATVLTTGPNAGKVLIAGGWASFTDYLQGNGPTFASAEIYDPATGTSTPTGFMNHPHAYHAATLLTCTCANNGKVLITGGSFDTSFPTISGADLYDPVAGTWSDAGFLKYARTSHAATMLPNGKVLIVGGEVDSVSGFSNAELYDTSTGTFTPSIGVMSAAFPTPTATWLPARNLVLIAGNGHAQFYDPSADAFSGLYAMKASRNGHTATLLPSGDVLFTGGDGVGTAELYNTTTDSFVTTASMSTNRQYHTATLLTTGNDAGKVLVTGGTALNITSPSLASAELFDPAGVPNGTFSLLPGTMTTGRLHHTATLLTTGPYANYVLLGGGLDYGISDTAIASEELYIP